MPRFHCPVPLTTGVQIDLPAGAARHVQVLRLQPGSIITLFNGEGGEFDATVQRMGRSDVAVEVGAHHPVEREAARAVHLLVGLTANERMDWLVEKAAELGVAGIWPVLAERSVLRLGGERAEKKQAHWQAVAVAACEQCGRNRVPMVGPVQSLAQWLTKAGHLAESARMVLSLGPNTQALLTAAQAHTPGAGVTLLSGPEGGLSPAEEALALAHGFAPVTLGPRVLRAETAPLAALAALTLGA
jgi:16S rRNA (uracil1498-N3)-methyltransferase